MGSSLCGRSWRQMCRSVGIANRVAAAVVRTASSSIVGRAARRRTSSSGLTTGFDDSIPTVPVPTASACHSHVLTVRARKN